MDEKISRMKELAATLTAAAKTYYQESREIMSNYEYDKLYDELVELEKETGVVLSKSPTQNVGYEVLSELPKERHESPMLSLDKTKSTADLQEWLGDQTGILSWKLDGLTVVLLSLIHIFVLSANTVWTMAFTVRIMIRPPG